jgi:hypothetical protein
LQDASRIVQEQSPRRAQSNAARQSVEQEKPDLARIDDLTATMVEEYGGVVQCARPIVETGANAFLAGHP